MLIYRTQSYNKKLELSFQIKICMSTTLSPFPPTLNCLLHASKSCCCSKRNKAVFADKNGLLTQIIPVVVQYVALPVRTHIECLHLQFLLLRQSHTNRTQKQLILMVRSVGLHPLEKPFAENLIKITKLSRAASPRPKTLLISSIIQKLCFMFINFTH